MKILAPLVGDSKNNCWQKLRLDLLDVIISTSIKYHLSHLYYLYYGSIAVLQFIGVIILHNISLCLLVKVSSRPENLSLVISGHPIIFLQDRNKLFLWFQTNICLCKQTEIMLGCFLNHVKWFGNSDVACKRSLHKKLAQPQSPKYGIITYLIFW